MGILLYMSLALIYEFDLLFENSLKILANIFNDIIYHNSTYSGTLNLYGKNELLTLQNWFQDHLHVYYTTYYSFKKNYLIMSYKEHYSQFYILDKLYFEMSTSFKDVYKLIMDFDFSNHKEISKILFNLNDTYNKIVNMEKDFYISLELLLQDKRQKIADMFIYKIEKKNRSIIWKSLIAYIKQKYDMNKKPFIKEYLLDLIPLKYKIYNKMLWRKVKTEYLLDKMKF